MEVEEGGEAGVEAGGGDDLGEIAGGRNFSVEVEGRGRGGYSSSWRRRTALRASAAESGRM